MLTVLVPVSPVLGPGTSCRMASKLSTFFSKLSAFSSKLRQLSCCSFAPRLANGTAVQRLLADSGFLTGQADQRDLVTGAPAHREQVPTATAGCVTGGQNSRYCRFNKIPHTVR